jgi:parallel beta-helix repeat protein
MIFNVQDYGARGDGRTDDTDAVQLAVNAASFDGGTVFIPSGTYILSQSILLTDGITLAGAGMGTTVLKIADNTNTRIVGLVRTPYGRGTRNVCVRDLTLDGNRDNQAEVEQVGFYCGVIPDQPTSDYDISCLRVEAHHFHDYGFDPHEVVTRLTLVDCVSHHNGLDGFTLDGVQTSIVKGCIAFNNDRHGFNLVTNSRFCILSQNLAYENKGNGFTIQNGSHSNEVIGSLSRENGGDGLYSIEVNDNAFFNNTVLRNQQNGIRIRGGARTTVIGNLVRENGQKQHNTYSEIILDDTDTSGATDCMVANNTVISRGDIRAQFGIDETAGVRGHEQERNAFLANRIMGAATANVTLNGRSTMQDHNI